MVLWTLPRANDRCRWLLSRLTRAARVGYRPKIAHELDSGDGWTGSLILCNSGRAPPRTGKAWGTAIPEHRRPLFWSAALPCRGHSANHR